MHSGLARISVGLGVLVGAVGIVLSTPVSGLVDSVVFWGLIGGLIAATGLNWSERRAR
jgi:hypothetical protein